MERTVTTVTGTSRITFDWFRLFFSFLFLPNFFLWKVYYYGKKISDDKLYFVWLVHHSVVVCMYNVVITVVPILIYIFDRSGWNWIPYVNLSHSFLFSLSLFLFFLSVLPLVIVFTYCGSIIDRIDKLNGSDDTRDRYI